jgi:uncharacterized membrane protein YpjA
MQQFSTIQFHIIHDIQVVTLPSYYCWATEANLFYSRRQRTIQVEVYWVLAPYNAAVRHQP